MKTSISKAVCCAILALSSGSARAQDAARVPGRNPDADSEVDASVHAGVDEQPARQSQSSRQPNKRTQTTYIRWGFQPPNYAASRASATRFQREQSTSLLAQPESVENPLTRPTLPEKPLSDSLQHGQDTLFGNSSIAGSPRSAAVGGSLLELNSDNPPQLQGLKSIGGLPSPFRRNNGLSSSLPHKKAEPSGKSPFSSPFSKLDSRSSNPLQAKSKKQAPPQPADRNKPASLFGRQAEKQN
jgi:hypothetical protein